MSCCGNCETNAGPCTNLARVPQMGAISTASVVGVPLVASAGAVAGGWGGYQLAKKQGTAVRIIALLVGAYAGSRVLPMATDAVGL
jgi:hypothetical protein